MGDTSDFEIMDYFEYCSSCKSALKYQVENNTPYQMVPCHSCWCIMNDICLCTKNKQCQLCELKLKKKRYYLRSHSHKKSSF